MHPLTKVYIVLSIVAIAVLSYLLAKKKLCGENYRKCVCSQNSGGRGRVCQNTKDLWISYNNGYTEYQEQPERHWGTVSPGDVKFPVSMGCGCA